MDRSSNDDRSDSMNPNNHAYDDSLDNHSNQLNPNNSVYWSCRDNTRVEEIDCEDAGNSKSYLATNSLIVPLVAGMRAPEVRWPLDLTIFYVDHLGKSHKAWVRANEPKVDFQNFDNLLKKIEFRTRLAWEHSSLWYMKVDYKTKVSLYRAGCVPDACDGVILDVTRSFACEDDLLQHDISSSITEIENFLEQIPPSNHLWRRGINYSYMEFIQNVLGFKLPLL